MSWTAFTFKCSLFLLVTSFLAAQSPQPITLSNNGSLGESHSNNLIRGRHNMVHMVYIDQDGNLIYHRGETNSNSTFVLPNATNNFTRFFKDELSPYFFPAVA